MSTQQICESDFKRLPRIEKKRAKKEILARFPSSPAQSFVRVKPARQPQPIEDPPEPPAKVPSAKLLERIANRYKTLEKAGYARAKDPQNDPQVLAAQAVNSEFSRVLGKHKGYDPHRLMELVIVDHIRVPRPVIIQIEEPPPVVKEKRLTARQQLQAARCAEAGFRPASSNTSSTHTRRRTAKTVRRRKKYDDLQIVQDALTTLFQDDSTVEQLFCETSVASAKQLLRTDPNIARLVDQLKRQLASPSRVYNYLDTAIRVIVPQYQQAQLQATQEAEQAAAVRRAQRNAEARELAARREQQRRREERYRVPFSMTLAGM